VTALWAYTGAADPELDGRMSASLRHRGHLGASAGGGIGRVKGLVVGVALPRTDPKLGGLLVEGEEMLGLAGRLTRPSTLRSLHATLRARGLGALDELGGEWIIAWVEGRRLRIIRDAVGVRTVYWGRHGGRVLLGIEPKAVLAAPGFPRRLDVGAVAQFLTFSFVPGERCTLRDLHELPAGHVLEIDLDGGDVNVVRWFVHEDIEPESGPAEEWVPRIRSAIDEAVAERIPSGEPVTTFLSGGLDSSIVTAVTSSVRRDRGESPPLSLSLHFGAEYPNELPYAQAVADRAGTEHSVVHVSGREVGSILREMVWHLDEPIGDPVTAGNYLLARLAADRASWVLNGEGGDPVFGGPKNLPMLLAHWYPTLEGPHAREERYLGTWRRAGDEVAALLHPDLRREFNRERDLIDVVRPLLHAERPAHFLNKLIVMNMRLKGAHLILPKVDRMLGAYGLTPLSPLFDADLVRLSLRLPPELKLRSGVEKWVLKAAYCDILPRQIIDRPKSGMRVPVSHWFRSELRAEAKSLLSPRAVKRAGIFEPQRVQDVLRYRTGRDGIRLWMLTTFELWRQTVLEPTDS
jgi:asparagine synthase (glutamine-hydrolysing)